MLLTRLHPEIRRRIAAAPEVFSKKLWREDMRRWDEEIKPDSIARNRKLQNTPIAALGDAEFLAHLEEVRANAVEMIYRHHIFTIPCMLSRGPLRVGSPALDGPAFGRSARRAQGRRADLARRRRRAARTPAGRARRAAASPRTASADARRSRSWTICSRSTGSREPLQAYLDEVGYRARLGLRHRRQVRARDARDAGRRHLRRRGHDRIGRADFTKRRDALRAKVPEAHRAEFDELLEEARFIHRLRDERGMYNDSWGTGLARRAMLEAGRRLVQQRRAAGRRRSPSTPATRRSSACSRARSSRASRSCAAARPGAKPRRSPTRRRSSDRSRRDRRRSNGCPRRRRPTRGRWTRSSARSSTSRCRRRRRRASPACRCIRASTKGRPGSSTARRISTGCSRATCS